MSGTALGKNKMVIPKREESYVCITCFLKDENKMVPGRPGRRFQDEASLPFPKTVPLEVLIEAFTKVFGFKVKYTSVYELAPPEHPFTDHLFTPQRRRFTYVLKRALQGYPYHDFMRYARRQDPLSFPGVDTIQFHLPPPRNTEPSLNWFQRRFNRFSALFI